MYSTGASDFEDTIPIWKFGNDRKIRLDRPTIYHRKADEDMRRAGTSGHIGYLVKNQYGDIKPMTFKQYHRMADLFEKGLLKVVDRWRAHHVPAEYALSGFDTEGMNCGFDTLG